MRRSVIQKNSLKFYTDDVIGNMQRVEFNIQNEHGVQIKGIEECSTRKSEIGTRFEVRM